jgi:hypothetical protein
VKLGAQNRNKVIIAAVLLLVALVLFVRMLNSPVPATASAPAPAAVAGATENRPAPAVQRQQGRRIGPSLKPTLDPRLRLDLLKSSEQMEYSGTGRNIFRAEAPPPPIPKPVANPVLPPQQQVYTPPPPPPINLKFFGFASRPGEPKKIFLSQGEDVFIAGEGDIVNRRYKVVRIAPNSVEIEDMLSNNRQSIPLTAG